MKKQLRNITLADTHTALRTRAIQVASGGGGTKVSQDGIRLAGRGEMEGPAGQDECSPEMRSVTLQESQNL